MQKLKEKVKEGKEMKRKLKFSIIVIVLVSSILLLIGGKAQASLQANPNTKNKTAKTSQEWITAIREMENTNGAMGLSEERNTNLTGTKSNNIDVHFMKSAEYGAIAILSASGYGNSSNAQAITSTTGNNTGMILDTNVYEYVSGFVAAVEGVEERYYNVYGDVKVGDAMNTCAGWHSASSSRGITQSTHISGRLVRGYGGIFSYDGMVSYSNSAYADRSAVFLLNGLPSNYLKANHLAFGRGVAVCGEGL